MHQLVGMGKVGKVGKVALAACGGIYSGSRLHGVHTLGSSFIVHGASCHKKNSYDSEAPVLVFVAREPFSMNHSP